MKKALFIVLIILSCVCLIASGTKEYEKNVRLAVMQGPTGFSSVFLDDFVSVEVYPSPNEAVSKLINGELDMAVLPVTTAVNLFNKGAKIKALALVGEGMLSVVGTKSNSILFVPGLGGTPDMMAKYLYPYLEKDFSITSPAQLAQLIISGKADMAILPEPFVSMVLSKNPAIKVLYNVQKDWKNKTGFDQYPMSILVASEDFAIKNLTLVDRVKKSFKSSIEKVLYNPEEASFKIEELGIMKANLAAPAIKNCALVYSEGSKAKELTDGYLNLVEGTSAEEGFWLK